MDNKPKQLKTLAVAVTVATLSACAAQQSTPTKVETTKSIPEWVMNPSVENGIADTHCVPAKPGIGMSYLKTTATALARAELAKQIGVKVKAMDKTYQHLADTSAGTSAGGSFESVSKQVTEKNLSGSRAIKMDYITLPDNVQNFCVMVAMSPEVTRTLFNELIAESGNSNISPQNEAVLYERFLSEKAAKELDAELKNSN